MTTDRGDANPPQGLRVRKKIVTREALSAAALSLAREHGPQNVRVEDIAAAAGVSPRTYNNYFASREQAILAALLANSTLRMGAALWRRPENEPLEDAVREALTELFCGALPADSQAVEFLVVSDSLRDEFTRTVAAIATPLTDAIASRLPAGPRTRQQAEVLAAAVSAVARKTVEQWLADPDGIPLVDAIRNNIDLITPALKAATEPPGPPRV